MAEKAKECHNPLIPVHCLPAFSNKVVYIPAKFYIVLSSRDTFTFPPLLSQPSEPPIWILIMRTKIPRISFLKQVQ